MLDFFKNGKGEILNLMFLNPDKKYYLAEIAKILGKEPSAYQKYIESFIQEGVFCNERIGNMRFFWLNEDYQLYSEIKNIISKTIGIEARLKTLLKEIDSIETAFIFGSFATDKFNSNSDIDLFMIGDEKQDTLIEHITKLETEVNRDINYHIYSKKEVLNKIDTKNDFIYNIFNREIVLLKGNINEFTKSK
ncbi:MAG: nucleotidyltransferase domain-containing protein [bacterium]